MKLTSGMVITLRRDTIGEVKSECVPTNVAKIMKLAREPTGGACQKTENANTDQGSQMTKISAAWQEKEKISTSAA